MRGQHLKKIGVLARYGNKKEVSQFVPVPICLLITSQVFRGFLE